ncbi:hypothetical protein [Xanthomonas sp. CFBP 8445]|uniref:hypothetical protein n=1 Tax=Xanthomonas sp. CFBP 8445 TaxID=2971236 RepID=UPI0021DFD620|nr:hypothetical protein [Xanthomonas sp. CFBP 8445]UYC13052.1 hypothetical protein NUG21_04695 [Xanthomonas sp. CFBP 8445]
MLGRTFIANKGARVSMAEGRGEDVGAAGVIAQLRRQNRILKIFSAVALAFPLTLMLMGARSAGGKQVFSEIDVKRINIVNEDGSRSMVLAAPGLLPDPVMGGKVMKTERSNMPGMLFYNGVGDEVGGLIYDGSIGKDGKPSGGVHLSMDRFGGDQQIALHHYEEGGFMETGLSVFDRGLSKQYEGLYEKYLAAPNGPEKDALLKQWKDAGGEQTQRLFVGRTRGKSSAVILADDSGNPRIIMSVTPGGKASLDFIDDKGDVIQSLPGAPVVKK